MRELMTYVRDYLLDALFPIRCLGCGRNREELPARERWLCAACREKLPLRAGQACPVCEQTSEGGQTHPGCHKRTALDGLWAAVAYDELVRRMVHGLKFEFLPDVAWPLAELMARSAEEAPEFGELQELLLAGRGKETEEGLFLDARRNARPGALLVPVPLHPRRKNWRGFNQSALLADLLGARFTLTVEEGALVRRRRTRAQSLIPEAAARRRNVAGAFHCPHPAAVQERDIVLIDDLCTTGSTLEECARELKRCGARRVWAWVVARR